MQIGVRLAPLALAWPIALAACNPSAGPEPFDAAPETAASHAPPVDAEGFLGRVTAGYQGWFSATGDASPIGEWTHWAATTSPAPGHVRFELYPDTRDYADADLQATSLGLLGDGRPARLFSSYASGVVDTHFRWMAEAGIDGVGLQRFVGELADPRFLSHRNHVAESVRSAAETWGRIFYVEYDVSGGSQATLVADIEHDWASVIEGTLGLPDSPRYARQDGRPVVLLWGLGFDDRPGTVAQTKDLVAWFKARGCFVGLGVPYEWRTEKGATKPGFLDAYATADLVQPWAVGAVASDAQVDQHFAGVVKQDIAWTKARGIAYQRVVYPGFGWSNWNGGSKNQIPRRAGAFFWRQAYRVREAGISAFIAMFDEYDEGTAIAKAAEDASMAPTGQYFLTLDADGTRVSSDFYLRLAGAATRMIEGQAPWSSTIPVPYGASAPDDPPPGDAPPDDPPPDDPPADTPAGDPVPPQSAWIGPPIPFGAAQAEVVVARLYRAVLGREVDPSGLGAYAPLVAAGELDVVVSALYGSGEFEARRGSLSVQSLAGELYGELLDREGDPGGLGATEQAIAAARAPERTAAMLASAEYAQNNP